jgi:hypothetical protein
MNRVSLVAAALVLLGATLPALAASDSAPAETKPAEQPAATQTPGDSAKKEPEQMPEEKAEKEARKACKIKICDILATKNAAGDDVSCDIVKTWREADITKMMGGKFTWPWGKAVCQSKLEITREPLAKAMSETSFEVAMQEQKVRCTLAQKDGEPYVVEVAMSPKVAFKDGKATTASINWGEASAPFLIYPLIYAGTGLDNSTNFLGPEVVTMVNQFTTKKCAEVKSDLPSNKLN